MSIPSKFPTMKDVAQAAQVSVQTVSAVVNDKPGITQETRTRVLQAIEQLGYRPYAVARSLRTRQTRTIALVLSDIANPIFAVMASAAENYAYSLGYSLLVYNTHDDVEREAAYIRTASQRWIEGVLFVAAQDSMDNLLALENAGIPYVAIDRIPEGFTGPSVTLDNVKAGRLAAEHLLDLGHKVIGHISGPLHLRLARERIDGFLSAILERGLQPGPCISIGGNWECETGYRAMQEMISSHPLPTAIFAANDRMAIGAMRAAAEHGVRIPEQLSIVGLDDMEFAAFQNPPLTTVRQPFTEMATQAVSILLEILQDRELVQSQILVQPELIVRQSTVPPLTQNAR